MTTSSSFAFGVDAAVIWPAGKVYFFKGSQYLRYDIASDRVEQDPMPIIRHWGNWPASWVDGINGGFVMPEQKSAYFFKGSQYLRYAIAADRVLDGYPRSFPGGWGNWPADWNAGIDGGVIWPNGKVYFFKGSSYLRYDLASDRVE